MEKETETAIERDRLGVEKESKTRFIRTAVAMPRAIVHTSTAEATHCMHSW